MASHLSYGPNVPHDGELRLCGDVVGTRAIELGIAPEVNAVALARAGAKAIAVDPSAERIAAGRTMAEQEGVRIEFHHGDLADLGFATSGSVDLVVAVGSLDGVDDLSRVLRQVHRILKPEHALVMSFRHPIAAMLDGAEVVLRRPYGQPPSRSISELFTAMHRTNFRVDVMHELFSMGQDNAMVPSTLIIRARKLGV
ncbi:MAG: class I SAM-dependent methyltransferase [Acidimicrobiia bacterium]